MDTLTLIPKPPSSVAVSVDLSKDSTARLACDISTIPWTEPIVQGYLRKEGSLGSWKKRWFVLRHDCLVYMKRPDSIEPQGSIQISDMHGITEDTLQARSFQIVTQGRVYAFQAPLEAAQRHWVSAINAVISLRKDGLKEDPPNALATLPLQLPDTQLIGAALDALDLISARAHSKHEPALAVSPESDQRLDAADLLEEVSSIPQAVPISSLHRGSSGRPLSVARSRAPEAQHLLPPSFESGEVSMLTGHPGFGARQFGRISRESSSDEEERGPTSYGRSGHKVQFGGWPGY
jgi:hypothetical protein